LILVQRKRRGECAALTSVATLVSHALAEL
jgi:hypothetical protein